MSHPVPPAPISAPPSRSTTEPPSSKSTHHHHIHRPHRHHGHHRDSSRVPQSAILPSSSNPFKDNSSYPIARDLFSPLSKVGSRFESSKHEVAPPATGADAGKNAVGEEDAEVVKKRERERESRERGVWAEVERRKRGRGEGDGYVVFSLGNPIQSAYGCLTTTGYEQPFIQNPCIPDDTFYLHHQTSRLHALLPPLAPLLPPRHAFFAVIVIGFHHRFA